MLKLISFLIIIFITDGYSSSIHKGWGLSKNKDSIIIEAKGGTVPFPVNKFDEFITQTSKMLSDFPDLEFRNMLFIDGLDSTLSKKIIEQLPQDLIYTNLGFYSRTTPQPVSYLNRKNKYHVRFIYNFKGTYYGDSIYFQNYTQNPLPNLYNSILKAKNEPNKPKVQFQNITESILWLNKSLPKTNCKEFMFIIMQNNKLDWFNLNRDWHNLVQCNDGFYAEFITDELMRISIENVFELSKFIKNNFQYKFIRKILISEYHSKETTRQLVEAINIALSKNNLLLEVGKLSSINRRLNYLLK